MKRKSFLIACVLVIFAVLAACSSADSKGQNIARETAFSSSHAIDLGEKLITGEFTTDLGKEAAGLGEYKIINESGYGYDCADALGHIIFSCKTFNKNITYKIIAENDIVTIFGIPLKSTMDEAESALSKYSFECTIDNAENGMYYRYYYVYASDTVFYEIGLFYNPDTMEIYDYEISRMDYS